MNNEICKGYYEVPEFVLRRMLEDMSDLAGMLQELIHLHLEETRLKKHHKPYLHIREYADIVCMNYERKLDVIVKKWSNAKISCEDLGCSCAAPEKTEGEKPSNKTENSASVEKTEGMVMMSEKTAAGMLDDLLVLAETIDTLTTALKLIISGQLIPDEQMAKMLFHVELLANGITSRWEDAQLIELS